MDMRNRTTEYAVKMGYYRIRLDKEGKIDALIVGNDIPQYRGCLDHDIDRNLLRYVLRHLMAESPEQFSEIYFSVKKNDPEMFVYVDAVVNSVGIYCLALTAEE